MNPNPSVHTGGTLPVEGVTWFNAAEYCNKLSEVEGLTPAYTLSVSSVTTPFFGTVTSGTVTLNPNATGYRLPTEAEWEYAARGGNQSQDFTYSGSNNRAEVSWYNQNSGNTLHAAGGKLPNELGLYDMSGNVREWCWDWWGNNYSSDPQTDPTGPASSSDTTRVLRGGGYALDLTDASTDYPYYRDHWSSLSPDLLCNTIGFRVARPVISSN
jgi:formylglycine-generating enzyme required for sulfatase activity